MGATPQIRRRRGWRSGFHRVGRVVAPAHSFSLGFVHTVTIITSHTGIASWGERLGDPMLAAAIRDRLLHTGIVVSIDGPSYRMRAHQQRSARHLPTVTY